ncbi:MAG: hypothetical protein ABSG31_12610 [Tepidisphaeraceae bacterium]|jgi:hypothetical protein
MSRLNPFSFGRVPHLRESGPVAAEVIQARRMMLSLLEYTGLTIDDVVNTPIAKNIVLGHFKMRKEVARRCEIVDLERQWSRP